MKGPSEIQDCMSKDLRKRWAESVQKWTLVWQGRSSKIGLEGPAGVLTATLRILGSDLEAVERPITIFEQETQDLSIYGKEYGREDEWQLRKSKGKLSS